MEDLQRKSSMFDVGHMTDVPHKITYASVVSRETRRIALTMASLNDMSVRTSDIMNNYIKVTCGENVYTILGPDFIMDEGNMEIIVKALYGLKSAGAYFQNHLAKCMQFMVYKPCLSDPGLWMSLMKRSIYYFENYE